VVALPVINAWFYVERIRDINTVFKIIVFKVMIESWKFVHRILIYSREGTGTTEKFNHTEYIVKRRKDIILKTLQFIFIFILLIKVVLAKILWLI